MTGAAREPTSEEQLEAIAHLSEVLDQQAVDYWLFGGWAVDFWVGSVTRDHDDIDVAAWRRDYETIKEALEAAGWRHTPLADEVVGTRFSVGAAQVEFTFLVTNDAGHIVVPIPSQPITWSTEPFSDHRRELLGVTSRTIPLPLLRAGKSAPRDGDAEGAKDRADFLALSRVEA